MSRAADQAYRIREAFWDGHLPVRTDQVIQAYDVPIVIKKMAPGSEPSSRAYYDVNLKKFACVFNDEEIIYRSNFALAHAFGHVVLGHVNDPAVTKESHSFSTTTGTAEDRAATAFAIELLMPERLVRYFFPSARKVQELAEAFGVSNQAMTSRLASLGII
ncbi:ImmA/IrrE family metallo-endopeptidase [Pseudomonas viridiflava]|uniref:ImmA/IrrE family metallo-endopeptidase n=1 Tax=Pseudomonas viridiflava TaxID=33069 RepID=UPI0018E62493|nr:ImmA/IrrE family metallo-endopeptidase [Pseudomonas viridiflava]MBI6727346.1 ImmA/IrrE family metallo-endopeptidase [Pseudomonas viridiflava]